MLWANTCCMGDSKWPEQILTWSPKQRNKKKKKKKKKETRNNLGNGSRNSDEAA